jgi:hypothetical protein
MFLACLDGLSRAPTVNSEAAIGSIRETVSIETVFLTCGKDAAGYCR